METEREELLAVVVMLSELCTAIVHQSLLEAKAVKAEQGFLRDPSLSAGMVRRRFSPREQRMDRHLHRQVHSERQEKVRRNQCGNTANDPGHQRCWALI